MKHLFAFAAVFVLTSGAAFAQAGGGAGDAGRGAAGRLVVAKCSAANPDPAYDRQRVLEQLAAVLNDSVPEHRKVYKEGFGVSDQKPLDFFVYDLTDTPNKGTLYDCVNFMNRHVYHFAAVDLSDSFSHLAFLEDGRVKVFKSVNCPERDGDRVEDALAYLERALGDDENKREVLGRVRDYRKYGIYVGVDPQSALHCEAPPPR